MEKYDIERAKNAKLSDLDKETLEKSNFENPILEN